MNDLFDLSGKVALLTGPDGNLGPIWLDTLVNAGAKVYSVGLPEVDFAEDWHPISIHCPEIPDIIVCNAAVDTPPSKVSARFFTDFARTMRVNLEANAKLLHYFLPDMVTGKGGVIVLIGSIMGYIGADWRNYSGGFEKPVAYNCSKAALQQLARSITVQYGRYGVRAVCPGFGPVVTGKLPWEFLNKITDKIPTGRTISERSLRQTLLYAICCEDLAGEDWLVDGGYTKW